MKILFVTKEIPYPVNNGYRTRTYSILKGLALENEVILACFGEPSSGTGGAMKEFIKDIHVVKEHISSHKKDSIVSLFLGLFSIIPHSIKKRYSPGMRTVIDDILTDKKIDLVICDSIYQTMHIPDSNIKKVISEHNIESTIIYRYIRVEKSIPKKIYAVIEYLKMRHYEDKIWKKFDYSFAVSEDDKHVMTQRIKKNNIAVIPNGVDTKYFLPGVENKRSRSLVYTGQMNWYPNTDAVNYFLSSIYPLIKKQIPDISFYVVGNNPPDALRQIAEKDASITITGFVEDVRSYMKKADVFVVPLRVGGGTRLKILEAMSMAKPVVSTSIGCEGLHVSDGKNIVVADDPADFANKVVSLINEPQTCIDIGTSGRNLVEEEYSWNKVIEALNKNIKDVCLSVNKGRKC